MTEPGKVKSLRQMARECSKREEYTEAFLHLTHALNLDPTNQEMLYERCQCLLKSQQYNLALQDGQKILSLSPKSGLGHASLAEIYAATGNHELALAAFQTAFQCSDSNKESCMEGITKAKREIAREKNNDRQFPFVGCALGITVSSLLLVFDYLSFKEESVIAHPVLKVVTCFTMAAIFYWGAKLYRVSIKKMRCQLLEPPPDLLQLFQQQQEDHPHTD